MKFSTIELRIITICYLINHETLNKRIILKIMPNALTGASRKAMAIELSSINIFYLMLLKNLS